MMRAWMPGLAGLFVWCTWAAAAPDDRVALLRARMQRSHAGIERRVLAFYYPWYGVAPSGDHGPHWGRWDAERKDAPGSLRWPQGGPYDSLDPEVVERHMRQLAEAGIDGPISSWWGPGDRSDQVVAPLLEHAERHGRKVTVYFETVRGEPPTVASATHDLAHLARRYASHEAWLRVGERPVIFLYARAMSQLGALGWVEALERARRECGVDWAAIADGTGPDCRMLFDGAHRYNPMALLRASDVTASVADRIGRDRADSPPGKIACLTIMPGYDDTKVRKPGAVLDRRGGDLYRAQWRALCGPAGACIDWVLITSFNEWHEGSEIEPSAELGDDFLRATAKWSAEWRARGAEARAAVEETRGTEPRQPPPHTALRALFERDPAIRVGLLNGPGTAGMWLIQATDRVDFVEPDALVEGRVDAGTHRVLLYPGGESYPTRAKEDGDVPAAIGRYLAAGGSLVVFANEPFPFYYDHRHARVVAGPRFGLHLLGTGQASFENGPTGFERPPEGADLRWKVETPLPSLSRLAAPQPAALALRFPSSGDLRWRPAYRPPDSPADRTYRSYLRLVDEHGRRWGDAVAVFGRKDPSAGRIVYAWFRLADVVGPDLLADLLRLALAEE